MGFFTQFLICSVYPWQTFEHARIIWMEKACIGSGDFLWVGGKLNFAVKSLVKVKICVFKWHLRCFYSEISSRALQGRIIAGEKEKIWLKIAKMTAKCRRNTNVYSLRNDDEENDVEKMKKWRRNGGRNDDEMKKRWKKWRRNEEETTKKRWRNGEEMTTKRWRNEEEANKMATKGMQIVRRDAKQRDTAKNSYWKSQFKSFDLRRFHLLRRAYWWSTKRYHRTQCGYSNVASISM